MYRWWGFCQSPLSLESSQHRGTAGKPLTHYRSPLEPLSALDSESPTAHWSSLAAAVRKPCSGAATWVGRSLGDLELLVELGQGGMGVVYKAWQKNLDRMVAVKALRSEHADHPVWQARFLAEARAAAALSHAHIVPIYQVGQCAAGPYFVMEYIDGPPLEALIQRGTLSLLRAVGLLRALARAVHYAHSKGILHRDLKPGNILVGPGPRPVIIDFGIARSLGTEASRAPAGGITGTPAYMAPEQAGEGSGPVGPPSDVYSLGAILYTMLTGRAPYAGNTAQRTLQQALGSEVPPALRSLQPQVPVELERICMKCLHKDPGQRYATAQALAQDLGRFYRIWRSQKPRCRRRIFAQGSSGEDP